MIKKEIFITIVDENNNEFLLEVQSEIRYEDLKQKIIELFNRSDFDLYFQDESIKKNNEILYLNEEDKIYLLTPRDKNEGRIYECYVPEDDLINIKFFENKSIIDDDKDMKTVNLSGLLKLCLLNYIIKNIDDFNIIGYIESNELIEIIFTLKTMVKDNKDIKEDIIAVLSENSGKNIFAYSKYVNYVVGEKEINDLINLLRGDKKIQIKNV